MAQTHYSGLNTKLNLLKKLVDRNLDSAILVSNQIMQNPMINDSVTLKWETMLYQGEAYFNKGQKDAAYRIFNRVLHQAQHRKNRIYEIKARIQIASNLQEDYRFKEAVDHLIRAEKLLKSSDPIDLRFRILNTLGTTHRKMKDYTSALKYFNSIEKNFFFQLNSEQRYNLLMNKGNVFAVMKDYSKAETLFNQAYDQALKLDNPDKLALITYNLGGLYYRQKKFQQAEEYIRESLEVNLVIGDQLRIEWCYRVLGAINMDQKNYSEAEAYFLKALDIAEKINHKKSILGNCQNLYLNYWTRGEETNNYDDLLKALNYYSRYARLNDSIYQIETAEKILELEKQYETEKKNNQIQLLEQENQLKEDKIMLQRTQRNYLLIFILLITGISVVFIYFYYYYRKVNRLLQIQGKRILAQRNQISNQNIQLQKSINTQNKLFSIIAHDLRSPLASISNVSRLIGFYLRDKRYDDLEKVAQMMDQKNEQVIELTDNLLSWAKSQTGSLKPLFEKVSLREIIEECFDLYEPIAETKQIQLTDHSEENLLIWADRNMIKTICRNLINNAIKFTYKGGSIVINYRLENNKPLLTVQDSGIGIPKEKMGILFEIDREKVTRGTEGEKSSGLGLTVCKEFTEAMKGKIWIESQPGNGSCFYVSLTLFDPVLHDPEYAPARKSASIHLLLKKEESNL